MIENHDAWFYQGLDYLQALADEGPPVLGRGKGYFSKLFQLLLPLADFLG